MELGEYRKPEFGAFVTFAEPQAQHVFSALNINSHSNVYGPVTDVAIGADLDHDRVEIHDWIHCVEGPLLPFTQLRQDGVSDLRDQLRGHVHPVDLLEMRLGVTGCHPSGDQRDHQIVEP